jgi:hypothetical protein
VSTSANCTVYGKKGKAVPVTSREGLQGCERSRLPRLLDS